MKNKYWEDRANKRMASYHKNSDDTIFKINNAYDKAIKDINSDIKKIFYKYQLDSNLTEIEARKLLNSKIPAKYIDSIRSRIKDIDDEELKKYLMAYLNADAYKARITRLEALKYSIYINSKVLADVELKYSNKLYVDNIKKAYYTNLFDTQKDVGLGFNVAQIPVKVIETILKNKWSGVHYSSRVWKNTDVLAKQLEDIITAGLMQGKSSKKMAKDLEDLCNVGKHAAERIIRTETTYVTTMAELESFKELGIEKYVFLATLDLRTSRYCREHDGKVYEVAKAVPGENLPPLHPHCRSTIISYVNEETLQRFKRRARDPETGKNYVVDNMSYEEWYNKFVIDKYGKDKADIFEKMIRNESSDRKQLNRYKEILGKESPKTLKDFQTLKYNNIEEWKLTKSFVTSKENKKISNNATLSQWKDISREANTKIVGIVTPNGIKITELSNHMIERFIGDGDKRIGVSVDSVRDALISPLDIKAIKVDDLDRKSQKFIGENATVSINPDTGNLIQTNPTSSKLAERLKRRKLDDKVK